MPLDTEKYKTHQGCPVYVGDPSNQEKVRLTCPTEGELKSLEKYCLEYTEVKDPDSIIFWLEPKNVAYDSTTRTVNKSPYNAIKDYVDSFLGRELCFSDEQWYSSNACVGTKGLFWKTALSVISDVVRPYGIGIAEVLYRKESDLPKEFLSWKSVLGQKFTKVDNNYIATYPALLLYGQDGDVTGVSVHPRSSINTNWQVLVRLGYLKDIEYKKQPPTTEGGEKAPTVLEINIRNSIAHGTTKFSEEFSNYWTNQYRQNQPQYPYKGGTPSSGYGGSTPYTEDIKKAFEDEDDPFVTGGFGGEIFYPIQDPEFREFLMEECSIYPGEIIPDTEGVIRVNTVQIIIEKIRRCFDEIDLNKLRILVAGKTSSFTQPVAIEAFKKVDKISNTYGSYLRLVELFWVSIGLEKDMSMDPLTVTWFKTAVLRRFTDKWNYGRLYIQRKGWRVNEQPKALAAGDNTPNSEEGVNVREQIAKASTFSD